MIEELQGTIKPDTLLKTINQMFSELNKVVSPIEDELTKLTEDAVQTVRILLNGNSVDDEVIWGLMGKQHFYDNELIDTPEYTSYKNYASKWHVKLFHLNKEDWEWNKPKQAPKPEIRAEKINNFKLIGRELLDSYVDDGFPFEHEHDEYGSMYPNSEDQVRKLFQDELDHDFTPEMTRIIVMGRKHRDTLKQIIKDVGVVSLDSVNINRTVLTELSTIERFIEELK